MVAVENAFSAFSKERWTRSERPRLRQLPQAAPQMLAPNDIVTFVDPGDKYLAKVDRPDAIVDFLESNRVWCKRVRDEEQPLLETEGARVGDALDEEVPGILDRQKPGIVLARRGPVERRGCPSSQMLMRPLLVVLLSELIEGALLGDQRGPRGPNGLRL